MELLTELKHDRKFRTISIAYLGTKFRDELSEGLYDNVDVFKFDELSDLEAYLKGCSILSIPDIILIEIEDDVSKIQNFVSSLRNNPVTKICSVILLSFKNNKSRVVELFRPYVNDIYFYPFNVFDLHERLKFIFRFKLIRHEIVPLKIATLTGGYSIPLTKRFFDIFVSSLLITLCSPILLLIAILIKLDSKGSIFYISKRAGSGYKIFNFYKFRSMRKSADTELGSLTYLNQYTTNGQASAFVKIANDPRITRLGAFLRNTSIDELPQLFNVLKGDMSLVGNRPLPLYEAQLLTSDEWAARFLGPAGITGLWQVSKRGRSQMSDEERRQLDNHYTTHFSFWMDLRILLKTIPAVFQKESV